MNRALDFTTILLALLGVFAAGAVPAKRVEVLPAQQVEQGWRLYLQRDAERRPATEFPYQRWFDRAAARHKLPVTLLLALALARGESDFDAKARSSANVRGLMQILWPGTAKQLGIHSLDKLLDPCTNVDAGARYLSQLVKRYKGNLHRALAAYNYGPGAIARSGSIPAGAAWYSGYIYRHLGYVLGRSAAGKPMPVPERYADDRKLEVLVFHEPFRAEAFVRAVEARADDLRLACAVGMGVAQGAAQPTIAIVARGA
jgi:hypothetical protein